MTDDARLDKILRAANDALYVEKTDLGTDVIRGWEWCKVAIRAILEAEPAQPTNTFRTDGQLGDSAGLTNSALRAPTIFQLLANRVRQQATIRDGSGDVVITHGIRLKATIFQRWLAERLEEASVYHYWGEYTE